MVLIAEVQPRAHVFVVQDTSAGHATNKMRALALALSLIFGNSEIKYSATRRRSKIIILISNFVSSPTEQL